MGTTAARRRGMNKTLIVQGTYYAATGVWSLLAIDSFQRVTGPKTDLWLVKTVGGLVTAIGVALLAGGTRRRTSPEAVVLAAGCAAGLATIDATHVAKRRISAIYLLDAAAEALAVSRLAISGHASRR